MVIGQATSKHEQYNIKNPDDQITSAQANEDDLATSSSFSWCSGGLWPLDGSTGVCNTGRPVRSGHWQAVLGETRECNHK